MGGWGGLIELLLVVAVIFGWGLLELRATKLDGKKAQQKKTKCNDSTCSFSRLRETVAPRSRVG